MVPKPKNKMEKGGYPKVFSSPLNLIQMADVFIKRWRKFRRRRRQGLCIASLETLQIFKKYEHFRRVKKTYCNCKDISVELRPIQRVCVSHHLTETGSDSRIAVSLISKKNANYEHFVFAPLLRNMFLIIGQIDTICNYKTSLFSLSICAV